VHKPLTLRVVPPEEVAAEEANRCRAQPSPRSTARCEMPKDHRYEDIRENFHAGRTRRGYWKFWAVTEEEARHDAG
jgi:hypothetical protein